MRPIDVEICFTKNESILVFRFFFFFISLPHRYPFSCTHQINSFDRHRNVIEHQNVRFSHISFICLTNNFILFCTHIGWKFSCKCRKIFWKIFIKGSYMRHQKFFKLIKKNTVASPSGQFESNRHFQIKANESIGEWYVLKVVTKKKCNKGWTIEWLETFKKIIST